MTPRATAWTQLRSAATGPRDPIARLMTTEPDRMAKLVVEAAGLRIDLSKQPWSLPDLDTALKYAALIPSAAYGTVEVRPLMDYNPAGN